MKGTGQGDVNPAAPGKDASQNNQESAKFNGQNAEASKANLDSLPFEYNVANMTQEINPSSKMENNTDQQLQMRSRSRIETRYPPLTTKI